MRFRKRPIVIEAVQFDGKNHQEINQFMGANAFPLQWEPDAIKIQTLEGTMTACSGDWIIKGVNGEFYPCKNEIFEKSYFSDGGSVGEISDGYHTFNELYDHRCLLFINLCLRHLSKAYWSEGYPGWPLLGMRTDYGQISYHVPEKFLHLFSGIVNKHSPDFDGHTSQDVLVRLESLAMEQKSIWEC